MKRPLVSHKTRAAVLTGALRLWRRPLAGNSSADMNVLRTFRWYPPSGSSSIILLGRTKKNPITLGAVAQFVQFAMAFHAQLPPLPSQLAAHDERQVPPFFGSADRSILAVGTQSVA